MANVAHRMVNGSRFSAPYLPPMCGYGVVLEVTIATVYFGATMTYRSVYVLGFCACARVMEVAGVRA